MCLINPIEWSFVSQNRIYSHRGKSFALSPVSIQNTHTRTIDNVRAWVIINYHSGEFATIREYNAINAITSNVDLLRKSRSLSVHLNETFSPLNLSPRVKIYSLIARDVNAMRFFFFFERASNKCRVRNNVFSALFIVSDECIIFWSPFVLWIYKSPSKLPLHTHRYTYTHSFSFRFFT